MLYCDDLQTAFRLLRAFLTSLSLLHWWSSGKTNKQTNKKPRKRAHFLALHDGRENESHHIHRWYLILRQGSVGRKGLFSETLLFFVLYVLEATSYACLSASYFTTLLNEFVMIFFHCIVECWMFYVTDNQKAKFCVPAQTIEFHCMHSIVLHYIV